MKFSFRQLEVFLAAAHFQNITRAADSLAMSQSAASSALKELESQFDIQLFAAGEIGPVGGRNHLHGFTASVLTFR